MCPTGVLRVAHTPEVKYRNKYCTDAYTQWTHEITVFYMSSTLTWILVRTALVIPGSPPTRDARPEMYYNFLFFLKKVMIILNWTSIKISKCIIQTFFQVCSSQWVNKRWLPHVGDSNSHQTIICILKDLHDKVRAWPTHTLLINVVCESQWKQCFG